MLAARSSLTIHSLTARAVSAPMRRPLGTSQTRIAAAPLVLIDLQTSEGVTGRTYLFCYQPALARATRDILRDLSGLLAGAAVSPFDLGLLLRRHFRLSGASGIVGFALAGIDMAAWDALAVAAEMPLATLLGGEPRPIRAYNSNGLGLNGPKAVAAEAVTLLEHGLTAMKIRLGYPTVAEDLAVVRAVRDAVPAGTTLMADYNQMLSVSEALARGAALDDEGLEWIEEPVRADDFQGAARIGATLRTPVQIGENFQDPYEMAKAIDVGAAGCMMPDVERIGGVSGWLRAAALADAASIPLSSHLFPEVSAHLLAVSPTAHFLEYVDWANAVLAQAVPVVDGFVVPASAPGTGLAWDEAAVQRYALD